MKNKSFLRYFSLAIIVISIFSIFSSALEWTEKRVIIELNDHKMIFQAINGTDNETLFINTSIYNIYPDYPLNVSYDTIELTSFPLAWNFQLSGTNLTGKGQTVCIIDTGVDYNHPDLGNCYGKNDEKSECKVIGGYDFINLDEDPMDDNGHGTHIAGILAAKGLINGAAPDARIVSIKALNSDGSGYSSDVLKGIEWCISNSEKFNIKSIILSLSTNCLSNPSSCSENHCNSVFEYFIQKAVEKNISVIAAAGNSGLRGLLPSPACVKKVIPVGASNQQGALWPNSNINKLVKLIAPGENIYSTLENNNYGVMSGTSMAVPQVVGAIAIINQAFSIYNKTKTPAQLEDILYLSGDKINEDSLNINLSRVNILEALMRSDEFPPEITTNYPKDKFTTVKSYLKFNCSAKDWQIYNLSFYLWRNISNQSPIYNYSVNSSEEFAELNIAVNNLSYGEYYWKCSADDKKGNSQSSKIQSLYITNISSTLVYPETNYSTNKREQNFLCQTESLSELSEITIYLWSTSQNIYNYSFNISGSENLSSFYYNFTAEGEYYWNCMVKDDTSSTFSYLNNSIAYNSTPIKDEVKNNIEVIKIASGGGGASSSSKKISNQTLNYTNKIKNDQSEDIFISEKSSENITKNSAKEDEGNKVSITGSVIGTIIKKSQFRVISLLFILLIIINIILRISLLKIRKS